MARSPSRATETSPLLRQEARSSAQLHRARYALIPLLVIAFVGILWISSSVTPTKQQHASTTGAAPHHLRRTPLGGEHNYTDSELLALLPPFESTHHPIPPKMINRTVFPHAVPTNAFWTNLLVGDDHGLNIGAGQITLSPYTVRNLPKRLDISYGDTRRVVTSGNITEYFNADVSLTAYSRTIARENKTTALLGDGNSTAREVVAFDPLSVTVQYRFENEPSGGATQWFDAHLVRGAPYVTVEYNRLIPVVEWNATRVLTINSIAVNPEQPANTSTTEAPAPCQTWTASRFEVDILVYGATNGAAVAQKWVLYFAQERTLRLQYAKEKDYRPYNFRGELTTPTNVRLVDADFYTGPLRVAVVPKPTSSDALVLLDTHASVYPVGSSVHTQVDNGTATIEFEWKTRTFASPPTPLPALLMLANPHHVETMSDAQRDAAFRVLAPLGHRTLKSFMTPVAGAVWALHETLPDVGFGVSQTLPSIASPEWLAEIKTSLQNDSNYTPVAQDPYFFGKEIGRQARLVLIADALGETTTRETLLDNLEEWIEPWLVAENEDPFVYDASWGGLCSNNGLSGLFYMSDFGNGWYNDHHFHYGYFLYSLAVVAKYRASFTNTHKAAIVSIARDIANSDHHDSYFPFARHFSWFDGHSFASGVYTLDGGKSQESVSEAINAYYGVYLLGQAMGIREVEQFGHVLLALESRAAQTYWQMPSTSTIYEPEYAQNKMTGQIAATKVSYTTWFGPEVEHMHLINMIPFTPITPTFLSRTYVAEEYPILTKEAFGRAVNPIDKRWSGYAYLAYAMLDREDAWRKIQALDFFDDGNSRTNSLVWIATQA